MFLPEELKMHNKRMRIKKGVSLILYLPDPYLGNIKKKVFKIQNNEIKKIRLAYEGWRNNDKKKVNMLKMDKKFIESDPDRKKDFHAEIFNDKYIKITGQGNFCNSIIIPNPYAKD